MPAIETVPVTPAAMKRFEIFNCVPARGLKQLAAATTRLRLPRGELLPTITGRASSAYVVVAGSLVLNVGAAPECKVVELAGAGDVLALAPALLGTDENISAEALCESTLLKVPQTALLACASATPALALAMAQELARQGRKLTNDIEGYALHTGRQRVADYLRHLAAKKAGHRSDFSLPAKKSIIASRLSLTPEYFSRTLRELISAGAISVNGRNITVLDAARLA